MNNAIVHIVDDDHDLRQFMTRLIQSVALETRVYSTADEFLGQGSWQGPGCILLDVRMPRMSGIELFRRFKKLGVNWPVIFVTGHGDVQTAVRAMRARAFDFIEKPFDNQFLLDRVQRAVAESEETAERHNETRHQNAILDRLTSRERQVLDMVVKGETNKVIAYRLSLSIKTVEVHRSNGKQKIGANSLAQLIKMYRSLGLV
jgi:two-component system, LuxR family, response regulator FixJ